MEFHVNLVLCESILIVVAGFFEYAFRVAGQLVCAVHPKAEANLQSTTARTWAA